MYNVVGNGYVVDFKIVIEYYKYYFKMVKKLGDIVGEGCVNFYFGDVYLDLGNYGVVICCYECCLEIVRESKYVVGEGFVYCDFGNVYYRFGDLKRVMDYYECFI